MKISPVVATLEMSYQGETNSRGEMHGKGTYTWPDGGRCAHPAWRRGAAGGD